MGFRRIVYSLDRPDVLSVYTVRMEADKAMYPILLSNGNKVDFGNVPDSGMIIPSYHDSSCELFNVYIYIATTRSAGPVVCFINDTNWHSYRLCGGG